MPELAELQVRLAQVQQVQQVLVSREPLALLELVVLPELRAQE